MIDILFSFFLNGLPLIILIIPLLFIWKKSIGKYYFRIVVGAIVFYFIYWVLPIIFQIGQAPNKLITEGSESENFALGIRYLAAHIGSLFVLFAFYPLVTLPFIFLVAPFISFVLLWNHLRTEEGTIQENLTYLTYEFDESPFDKIRRELMKNDWTREKEILKLMIVLLPISLYLLQTILDISGLQNISLTTGESALGWFIEILLVYLATFIFSIELLFSSKIAIKGRYWGNKLRKQTYRSLYSVGAPISILSLILFIVQYTASIFIIIYFFAYFIMVSIIFVLFLKIFEPISIFIFVKIIEYWKKRKDKTQKFKATNWYYMLVSSAAATGIFLILSILVFNPLIGLFREEHRVIIDSARFSTKNPTLRNSFRFDLMNIFNLVVLIIIPIFITAYLFAYSLKYLRNIVLGIVVYFSIVMILSIVFYYFGANPLISFAPLEYWLTGQLSYTDAFGFNFYTFRTAVFNANLFPGGKITLLGVLALPYLFTRYLMATIFWGLMIFYFRKDFKVKTTTIDDKFVEKTLLATIGDFLTHEEYLNESHRYLISKNFEITEENIEQENEDVKSILNALEQDKFLQEILPTNETEKKKLYSTLQYLYKTNKIKVWLPEFNYRFEKVEKQGLYVIYKDGRDLLHYPFVKEQLQDPGLISGMFSALTSFIKETTKSTELLKTIDHGDITILLEYGLNFFGALFIKGNETSEIREQLVDFIDRFGKKHKNVLADWNGMLAPFRDDTILIKEIFTEG
ncbi:MAG: hypothetical protein ACFFHV_11965 [Promethearchaeota archaeon]